MVTVAICPTLGDIELPQISVPNAITVPTSSSENYVPSVCTFLAKIPESLILVLFGQSAIHAPAIGFSRRSLHRPVLHYVLVDPHMPTIGGDFGDWPDAQVTLVISQQPTDSAKQAVLQARLRGWTITHEPVEKVLSQFNTA